MLRRPCADTWPVTLPFGPAPGYPNATQTHYGKDYGTPKGTLCWFREAGTITWTGLVGQLGLYCQLQSDANPTIYWGLAHLSLCFVIVGEHVNARQVIGETGGVPGDYGAGVTTGPHLHEEKRIGSQWGERIDPDSEESMTKVEQQEAQQLLDLLYGVGRVLINDQVASDTLSSLGSQQLQAIVRLKQLIGL